eukprot:403350459
MEENKKSNNNLLASSLKISLLQKLKEKQLQSQEKQLSQKTINIIQTLIKQSKKRTTEDLETLIPIIQKIQFFKEREIKQENYRLIVESLTYENHSVNTAICEQGEQGDKFYIIIDGTVGVRVFNKEHEAKRKEIYLLKNKMNKQRKVLTEMQSMAHEIESKGQEVASELMDKIFNVKNELTKKEEALEVLEKELSFIPESNELMKLTSGQSFGELALITSKPRSANIICISDCHFAVMNKADYERVLQKIELKIQVMKQEFLQQISFIKRWSRKNLQNLQYYMSIKEYPRGALVFKEGDRVEYVAIVKTGEFSVCKKVPKNITDESEVESLILNIRKQDAKSKAFQKVQNQKKQGTSPQSTYNLQNDAQGAFNQLTTSPYLVQSLNQRKTKVMDDISLMMLQVALLGSGQLFGEIDVVFERNYTYSLYCNSVQNQLYLIKADDFQKLLQNVKGTWQDLEIYCNQKNDKLIEMVMKQFMTKWQNKKQMSLMTHHKLKNMPEYQQQKTPSSTNRKLESPLNLDSDKKSMIIVREKAKGLNIDLSKIKKDFTGLNPSQRSAQKQESGSAYFSLGKMSQRDMETNDTQKRKHSNVFNPISDYDSVRSSQSQQLRILDLKSSQQQPIQSQMQYSNIDSYSQQSSRITQYASQSRLPIPKQQQIPNIYESNDNLLNQIFQQSILSRSRHRPNQSHQSLEQYDKAFQQSFQQQFQNNSYISSGIEYQENQQNFMKNRNLNQSQISQGAFDNSIMIGNNSVKNQHLLNYNSHQKSNSKLDLIDSPSKLQNKNNSTSNKAGQLNIYNQVIVDDLQQRFQRKHLMKVAATIRNGITTSYVKYRDNSNNKKSYLNMSKLKESQTARNMSNQQQFPKVYNNLEKLKQLQKNVSYIGRNSMIEDSNYQSDSACLRFDIKINSGNGDNNMPENIYSNI